MGAAVPAGAICSSDDRTGERDKAVEDVEQAVFDPMDVDAFGDSNGDGTAAGNQQQADFSQQEPAESRPKSAAQPSAPTEQNLVTCPP